MKEQVLSTELHQNERLIWSGQPKQGILFRISDVLVIPFSIVWGGSAIYWEYRALQGNYLFRKLWGLIFVFAGLYMMFGRFWDYAMQRKYTYYGVTNERIIIISMLFRKHIKSLPLDTLTNLSLHEKSRGTGTITFETLSWHRRLFGQRGWPGTAKSIPASFEMIENVRKVYELIREAQRNCQ